MSDKTIEVWTEDDWKLLLNKEYISVHSARICFMVPLRTAFKARIRAAILYGGIIQKNINVSSRKPDKFLFETIPFVRWMNQEGLLPPEVCDLECFTEMMSNEEEPRN